MAGKKTNKTSRSKYSSSKDASRDFQSNEGERIEVTSKTLEQTKKYGEQVIRIWIVSFLRSHSKPKYLF